MDKDVYLKIRKQHKDPIRMLFAMYNTACRPKDRIESINVFQGLLSVWMARNGKTLIAGSLTVLKFYDSKFAQ